MNVRPRINRWTPSRRDLLFGDSLLNSLVQPHFVVEGTGVDEPIHGMPGIHQQSVDVLLETIKADAACGIKAVMLFGVVAKEHKDSEASHASNRSSHLHRAVMEIKAAFGDDLVVMTDVCLCTATDHGVGDWSHDSRVHALVGVGPHRRCQGQVERHAPLGHGLHRCHGLHLRWTCSRPEPNNERHQQDGCVDDSACDASGPHQLLQTQGRRHGRRHDVHGRTDGGWE